MDEIQIRFLLKTSNIIKYIINNLFNLNYHQMELINIHYLISFILKSLLIDDYIIFTLLLNWNNINLLFQPFYNEIIIK